jgi:hypothetical protein
MEIEVNGPVLITQTHRTARFPSLSTDGSFSFQTNEIMRAPVQIERTYFMNRRNFMAGSVALAGQHKLLNSMEAISVGAKGTAQATSPQNLLSTTFTESFLESKLVPLKEWHPYPRWSERGPWQAVPADIQAAFVEKAQADVKAGWPALLATAMLDFKRDGNRTRFEQVSFGRRGKLLRLVLAECMEGKGRFLDDIANGVWLICEESFWGVSAHLGAQRVGVGLPDVTEPIIDLFAAATVSLLAWTKYLLGDQLETVSPLIGKRITLEAEQRILKPARDRDDFGWSGLDGKGGRLNNWNPWINSNLIVANLILEEDPKLRVHELTRIAKSVDQYLNQYWPDGGEEEGPGYFSVSPMCYFECVSLLESATGNSTKVFATPFIDAMGRYIMAAHVAGADYINYGDAPVKAGPDGDLLYRYGKAVHDDQLQAFGAYYAAKGGWTASGEGLARALEGNLTFITRALPGVLQANEIRSARREDVLTRDAWYPNLGLMTARQKANSAEGMYVAVLAANNGRSHSHNDTGSFIVYQDGEPVTVDVGVEAYSAKTFGRDRYKIWTMQSAFHNLPTVGGVMQREGGKYKATQLKYESNDDRAVLAFDLAATYPKEAGVKSWIRTVTLDRVHGKVTVEENFDLERSVPVSMSLMTCRVPSADASGNVTLKMASGEGKPASVKFNGTQMQAVVEKIPVADEHLAENWGHLVYRVLLNSKQPVTKGTLSYEFTRA